MQKQMKQLTRNYPVSKTLRFELKPVGNTMVNILASGLLEQDVHRAESYVKVKQIIDRYHKAFIEDVLSRVKLNDDDLNDFDGLYALKSRDSDQKKRFEKVQLTLRKKIAEAFLQDERYKRIDKKELIKEDLLTFVSEDDDKKLLSEFTSFTTYFTGFHENRKNMYSADAISTAIAYRLIHENLPKFIDNINVFRRVQDSAIAGHFGTIQANLPVGINVKGISEFFELNYYSSLLSQSQIDVYNFLVGQLNMAVNLYNQSVKERQNRLPKFKQLFKQILSDRNAIAWLPESFKSDNEMLEAIQKAFDDLNQHVFSKTDNREHSLSELLQSLGEYELDKIYVKNDAQLTEISQRCYGNWDTIKKGLVGKLKSEIGRKNKKETDEAFNSRIEDILKSLDSISLDSVNRGVNEVIKDNDLTAIINVQEYFASCGAYGGKMSHFERINDSYAKVKDLLNTPYPEEKNIVQDEGAIEKIKVLLDSIKDLQHFVKPLLGNGDEPDKDERFYAEFLAIWEELNKINPLYNMVRNYVTRKPYSTEKIKLNFENSTLMDGWDLNKEQANTTVILRKGGLYYLAVMNKRHSKVFDISVMPDNGECYEKMEYKLLPGANKMLPKVFFSKSRKDEFAPSATLLENYRRGTHKKGDLFSLKDCHDLIDFFKASINKHEDWSKFGFNFSNTETYEDLSGFYREVEQQGYKITFRNVSTEYVDSLVESGKIYLFQIYNKDFSPYSKGTPNLHTLYWKMLFDERNLRDVVYKLNGQAEVFYRKSSLSVDKPTHPANQDVANKNPLNKKRYSRFEYDLIKDKRYTVDKFMFHVPITMNFKSEGRSDINQLVNRYIKESSDLHIIGIDRGERHLLYVTIIDLKGRIVEKGQFSLNTIGNNDYHEKLERRGDKAVEARQTWKTVEGIKELKEGYLSLVVHEISQLILKYNAIVVLEDLNIGFKRSRQKVEHSVYQKFEKMLIDKLNYFVDKQRDADSLGGLLNAYQLTNKFESFQKLGKQSGVLFYVPAWNTSKMDPVTGFVNLFNTSYESIERSKEFFRKFDSITYNPEKDFFEFKFDYSKFTTKAEGSRLNWTLCSYGKRIKTYRSSENNSQFVSEEIDLTAEFKKIFDKNNIAYDEDIKAAIVNQNNSDFYKELLNLLKLLLQLRNSETGTLVDYLSSPVANEKGEFYNSETCDESLPKNADANGAFNIARKGLWVVRQIKCADDIDNIKLAVSNKEWLSFAQEKPYLND